MEQSPQISRTPKAWWWSPHLWPLYCAFAERILSDFGDHKHILFAGLPEPMEGYDPPITQADLSSAYSVLNDPEDVKRFGKFYTPAPVVSYMLRQLGYPEAHSGPLLDPACGTGAFLVEATRRYLAVNPKAEWEDLVREIKGIDVDPVAILIARARVLEAALGAGLEVNEAPLRIDCRDALALERSQPGTLFEDLGERKGELAGYVVGNPPYGKVHSSDIRITPYKETVHGHANLYGIFLALAVRKLRPGGRLGFVVPRSFASGLYFKNLRRHLLNTLRFNEVTVFGSRSGVFSGVLQETLLLLASKGGKLGKTLLREAKDPTELIGASSNTVWVSADKLSLGARYDHSLVLSANPVTHEVLEQVRRYSRPLAEHGLKASTGRLVWNRVKPQLRDEQGLDTLRVYWPANVCRYVFDLGLREEAKPNYAILNDHTRSALSYPEDLVIIKRTSAKEQACRIEAGFVSGNHPELASGFFLENHLNFIRRASGSVDLRLVCAVLNSRITNAIFSTVNGNTQVSATELMHLPLPKELGDPRLLEPAASLTDADIEDRSKLAETFERRLWEVYKLPEDLVESFLGTGSTSTLK